MDNLFYRPRRQCMLVKQSVRTLKVWASDQFWVSKFGVMVKRCSQAGLPFSLSPTGHTTTRVRGRRGGHCTPDHNCNKQVKLHHTSRPPTEPTNMCRKLQSQEVSGLMQGVSLAAKTFLTNWGSRKEGFLRFKDCLLNSLIHSPRILILQPAAPTGKPTCKLSESVKASELMLGLSSACRTVLC